MLKKLFSLLGYIPKEEVTIFVNELKKSTILMDRARIVIKGLKKNIKILEKAVITKNKEIQSIISKSDYKVKQLNAKNLRLLCKQGEFKEEIKKLTIVNEELTKDYQELFKNALSSMRQSEYYKTVSEAAIEKLEYLCFGSVLPKALRPSSLDRYQHLYKPVTPTYFKDRYGRPAIGVEYGQSED